MNECRLTGNRSNPLAGSEDFRHVLSAGLLVLVENASVSADAPPPSGFSARHQVVLTYHGVFGFHVGSVTRILDAKRTLYVTGGQDFSDSNPVGGIGHACVLLTPSQSVLDEVRGSQALRSHGAFKDMSRPATPRLQLLAHQIRSHRPCSWSLLRFDELAIAALSESLNDRASGRPPPSRIVDRAKQLLHANGHAPVTLDGIAREVGVSPVYLTQQFTRSEGVPLYRYHMQLRQDISGLAEDLGFSSPSHFSAVFRTMFGLTPSEFRSGKGDYAALQKIRHI
jgi:AraC family transcriptional regulator